MCAWQMKRTANRARAELKLELRFRAAQRSPCLSCLSAVLNSVCGGSWRRGNRVPKVQRGSVDGQNSDRKLTPCPIHPSYRWRGWHSQKIGEDEEVTLVKSRQQVVHASWTAGSHGQWEDSWERSLGTRAGTGRRQRRARWQ